MTSLYLVIPLQGGLCSVECAGLVFIVAIDILMKIIFYMVL